MAIVRMSRDLNTECQWQLGFEPGKLSHFAVLRILVAISALLAMRSVFKRSILIVLLQMTVFQTT